MGQCFSRDFRAFYIEMCVCGRRGVGGGGKEEERYGIDRKSKSKQPYTTPTSAVGLGVV